MKVPVMAKPMRAVILASGDGSNAEAIVLWARANPGRVEVRAILTDNPQAGVIQRAERLGIPCICICFPEKEMFPDGFMARKRAHENAVAQAVEDLGGEWLLLAGYMRILSGEFLSRFAHAPGGYYRVVNIHPSLLPEYPGKDALRRAFNDGAERSGITVHLVDEGVDSGPVVVQESFPRLPDDDFAAFAARGRQIEHRLFGQALAKLTDFQITKELYEHQHGDH
ncbi:MAG: hypothetical protein RIQ81_234 [Pseudomonadota bacterium]|jgi:phosphoribosylglycinamide formyltransferase-1